MRTRSAGPGTVSWQTRRHSWTRLGQIALRKARSVYERALLATNASTTRRLAARYVGSELNILVSPNFPHHRSVLYSVSARIGMRLTRNPNRNLVAAIFWQDATVRSLPVVLERDDIHVFNALCTDISKSTVSSAYESAFGRSLSLDPSSHRGVALEKPEANGSHFGRKVECPCERRPGYSYQKLIDNTHDDVVEDIRVAYIAGFFPIAYLKERPISDRYSNTNTSARVVEVGETLSEKELTQLGSMAGLLGIDYGEFDCLRNQLDGLLYVVDANPTPWGPPNHLPPLQREDALTRMAYAFESAVKSSNCQLGRTELPND